MKESTQLKEKNFQAIIFGGASSSFATSAFSVALSLYILELTKSAAELSLILFIGSLPPLLFSLIVGAICDRFNKKKIIIYADLSRVLIGLLFLLILFLIPESSIKWVLYIVTFLFSLIEVFSVASVNSIIPQVIDREKILEINNFRNALMRASLIIAPALSVMLFQYFGIYATVVLITLSYFLSFLLEYKLQYKVISKPQGTARLFNIVKEEFRDGKKLFTHDVKILSLNFNGLATHLFLFPFLLVGLPYLITQELKGMPFEYGIAESCTAIGALLSVFIVPKLKRLGTSYNLMIGMIGMFVGACIFLLLLITDFKALLINYQAVRIIYFSLACFFIFLSFCFYGVHFSSYLHQNIEPCMLGKGMAIQMTFIAVGRAVGFPVFGYLFTVSIEVSVASLIIGMFIKFLIHIPFMVSQRNQELVKS